MLALDSVCTLSISGVEAATAFIVGFSPVPVIGAAKIISLFGLVTVSVAFRGDGHWAGGVPTAQVSSGAKLMVTTQDCPPIRLKGCPCDGAALTPHESVSAKLLTPSLFVRLNVTPPRAALEAFASVIVCVAGGKPSVCTGKIKADGVNVIGPWQAFVPFNARHIFPKSPAAATF